MSHNMQYVIKTDVTGTKLLLCESHMINAVRQDGDDVIQHEPTSMEDVEFCTECQFSGPLVPIESLSA